MVKPLGISIEPKNRKYNSKIIIHSSTDKHYPLHKHEHGPWYYFRAEISRTNIKGLGFVTGIREIYLDDQLGWTNKGLRMDIPESLINVFRK
nr:hypothetical protein [Mucilaginibacter sp. FT3.2]